MKSAGRVCVLLLYSVTGFLVAAGLLSCLKRTVSRTLFILASLHIRFATLVFSSAQTV